MKNILIFICVFQTTYPLINGVEYEPTWDSLDNRPLPEWYDKAKVGIFLHWGVYAVPGFGSEWFWMKWKGIQFFFLKYVMLTFLVTSGTKLPSHVEFMKKNYPPNFTYQDFAKEFKAEFYDPEKWAELFKASGAK